MADFISGTVKIGIGGFILAIFVPLAMRSIWNKQVRDSFLSSPHVRNPTVLHKAGFAVLTVVPLVFAGWLVVSGLGHFGALFS